GRGGPRFHSGSALSVAGRAGRGSGGYSYRGDAPSRRRAGVELSMTAFGVSELFPLLDPERRRHGGASPRAGNLPADRQERPPRPRGRNTPRSPPPPSSPPLRPLHLNAADVGSRSRSRSDARFASDKK